MWSVCQSHQHSRDFQFSHTKSTLQLPELLHTINFYDLFLSCESHRGDRGENLNANKSLTFDNFNMTFYGFLHMHISFVRLTYAIKIIYISDHFHIVMNPKYFHYFFNCQFCRLPFVNFQFFFSALLLWIFKGCANFTRNVFGKVNFSRVHTSPLLSQFNFFWDLYSNLFNLLWTCVFKSPKCENKLVVHEQIKFAFKRTH